MTGFDHLAAIAAARTPALHAEIVRIGRFEIGRTELRTAAQQLYLSVVSQQLSVKAADTIWGRIVAAARESGATPPDLFCDEHAETIRRCGLSRNKFKALQAVRAAERQGLLDDATLAALQRAERCARLTGIWGIGQWTADMLGIFHFLDPDIWPDGDVAARGTLKRLTGCTDTVAEAAFYAPHRSLLARILWRVRDMAPVERVPVERGATAGSV